MKYQDFSFYLKIISSSRAVKILFLSFTCEDIGVAMVTNKISQLQESFPLRRAAGSFAVSKMNKQNIIWPLGDTNLIFSCWKYLSREILRLTLRYAGFTLWTSLCFPHTVEPVCICICIYIYIYIYMYRERERERERERGERHVYFPSSFTLSNLFSLWIRSLADKFSGFGYKYTKKSQIF